MHKFVTFCDQHYYILESISYSVATNNSSSEMATPDDVRYERILRQHSILNLNNFGYHGTCSEVGCPLDQF